LETDFGGKLNIVVPAIESALTSGAISDYVSRAGGHWSRWIGYRPVASGELWPFRLVLAADFDFSLV